MKAIEIARKLAELNRAEEAQKAYTLALNENNHEDPVIDFEAATYFLCTGGDQKIAFTQLILLYNQGHFQSEIFDILTETFYWSHLDKIQKRYEANVKKLSKYKYLFRKDFQEFNAIDIKFFPFGEGVIPYHTKENCFGEYIDVNRKIIDRYFFGDLVNPIFQIDLYSQYQLEYLYDNVRKSEWVARDNHIYLHYTSWQQFCIYLQLLDFNQLLKDEKFIFLIEEEEMLYPIDFKEKFGIDYSTYAVKPIAITEVNKLIWHAQFTAHNGAFFFNEVLDDHPNLLILHSWMLEKLEGVLTLIKINGKKKSLQYTTEIAGQPHKIPIGLYLHAIKNITEKDALVAITLSLAKASKSIDDNARIVPAVLIQPHFGNIVYSVSHDKQNRIKMYSEEFEKLKNQPIFRQFKYIKTFAPMRRPTTSYAATMKYKIERKRSEDTIDNNQMANWVLNCSSRVDLTERLYKDSRLVRFEDGKLNSRATFTALAEFLDIPYTESMTYCSLYGQRDAQTLEGSAIGFDTSTVHKAYEAYAGENERYLLEYLMRDAYEQYGYSFHYYNGQKPQVEKLKQIAENLEMLYGRIRETYIRVAEKMEDEAKNVGNLEKAISDYLKPIIEMNKRIAVAFSEDLYFVNNEGQPLQMLKPLELDKKLLEQPLYR